ncbi:MAG: alpha/beta hydrolase [Planctomycetota bacterium]
MTEQKNLSSPRVDRWLPGLVAAAACVAAAATPAWAEEARFEHTRGLTYAEPGGVPLKADVFAPPRAGEGPATPRPGVLVVHGGAWMQGRRTHMAPIAARLAENGYVAVSIDYRLAPDHKFPAQIEDCRQAVRWMRENAGRLRIDPQHIGAVGISAGGHLVSLLATDQPADEQPANGQHAGEPNAGEPDAREPDARPASSRVQMAVGLATPCDFRQLPPNIDFLAYWLGGTRGELPDTYRAASPAAFVTPDDPPLLLIHGSKDRLVPVAGPRAMYATLQEAGVVSELLVIDGGGHNTPAFDAKAVAKMSEFFATHLPTNPATTAADSGKEPAEAGEP